MSSVGGPVRLGFNCDHVATLRQARREGIPDPIEAGRVALGAGADQITAHLREDRRHIQEDDLRRMKAAGWPINLEMAARKEILDFALDLRPFAACLVPERREEVTTEGGIDAHADSARLAEFARALGGAGIRVSFFVDPDPAQVEAAARCGANCVELHTGPYARKAAGARERLAIAARAAGSHGLELHAGHGLDRENLSGVRDLPGLAEVNIGFSILARAVFVGLSEAITEVRRALDAPMGARR